MTPFPALTSEHEKFAALEGDWSGEEKIYPSRWDPDGGPAEGNWSFRRALNGFYLIGDYCQIRRGEKHFFGHGVFGWDPRGRCHTLHWFDCLGVEHDAPHLGHWNDQGLALEQELRGYGATRQVYAVEGDTLRFSLESSSDGAPWSPFLEGIYSRT